MIVYGMNRWKFAKAPACATGEGSGQMHTKGEDGAGPIKKGLPERQVVEDDGTAAAMALSPILRPAGEGSDGPIKKSLRVRGSERLQAVQPGGSPDPGQGDRNDQQDCSAERAEGRPARRRRRRRRSTRASVRPSPAA